MVQCDQKKILVNAASVTSDSCTPIEFKAQVQLFPCSRLHCQSLRFESHCCLSRYQLHPYIAASLG